MLRRLFWLFVLCCGLLLALSLMVVAQEAPAAAPTTTMAPWQPAALIAPPTPAPREQAAVKPHTTAVQVTVRRALPDMAPRPVAKPFYQLAYYAFHYPDKAG